LTGAQSVNPTFTPDVQGEYVIQLTVDDGRGGVDTDTVRVTAHAVLVGDANDDGVVDLKDAILCAEGALRLRALTAKEEAACDVVEPFGIVDGRDVIRIAEIALGIASAAEGQNLRAYGEPIELALENATLAPGERAVLRLFANPAPKGLQVGPEGSIRFDPRVIRVLGIRAVAPFSLLAAKIDHARGSIRFMLARLGRSVPGDGMKPVLELEVEAVGEPGQASPIELRADLLLDDQGKEAKARIQEGSVVIKPPIALRVERVELQSLEFGRGYRFWVRGEGIRAIEVYIFDLRGRRVFTSGRAANGLLWRGQGGDGRRLANGVYLYVVRVYGFQGEVIQTQVRKLIVLR